MIRRVVSEENERLRIATAEALAKRFNEADIRYAVVNGLYGYPDRIGRDLDILIHPKDVPLAVFLAEKVKKLFKWDYLFIRWSYYSTWQLFFICKTEGQLTWLEIDLMCDKRNLILGITPLILGITQLIEKAKDFLGPFRISKEGEYIKAQLRPILYKDIQRFEKKYPLHMPEGEELLNRLNELMGKKLLQEFLAIVKKGPKEVKRKALYMKWRVNLNYAFHHPLTALKNAFWTRICRPIMLYLFNAGPIIAVVGPDGVGKSTAIQETLRYLNGCFDVRVRHWRPKFLPDPHNLIGADNLRDYTQPSRKRVSFFEHWARIFYYYIDYTLGYLIRDRFLPLSVIQFVFYDRCALDMAVDPKRYKLSSDSGTWLSINIAPSPDKVILLTDTPQNIRTRKQELTAYEIEQQLTNWQKLKKEGKVQLVVQVEPSPGRVGRSLALEILNFLNSKYSLRKNKAWEKSVRLYGYTEISIGSEVRLSFSSNLAKEGLQNVLNLYTPYKMRARCLYFLLKAILPVGIFNLPNIKFKESPSRLLKKGWDWEVWLRQIEEKLKQQKLQAAFLFPYQKYRRKACCLFLNQEGKSIAFGKLGWSKITKQDISNEAKALNNIKKNGFESFQTIDIISTGCDEQVCWNLYTLLPLNSGKQLSKWNSAIHNVWLEITRNTEHYLMVDQIQWLDKLISKGPLWQKAVSILKQREPKEGYSFCMAHGDMSPWNIMYSGDDLWLYDWENFSTSSPLYTDPIHFYLRCGIFLKNLNPEKAVTMLVGLNIGGRKIEVADILMTLCFWRVRGQQCYKPAILDQLTLAVIKLI